MDYDIFPILIKLNLENSGVEKYRNPLVAKGKSIFTYLSSRL
jgi:hypothetical protein